MEKNLYTKLFVFCSMQLFLGPAYGGGYETLCEEQGVDTNYSVPTSDTWDRVSASYRVLHSGFYKDIKGEFKRLISLEKSYDIQASELFTALRKKVKASNEQDECYQAAKLCEQLLEHQISEGQAVVNTSDEFKNLLVDPGVAASIDALCGYYQALDKFDTDLDIHLQKVQKIVQDMGVVERECLWLGDYLCGCISSLLCCLPCLMNSCGYVENSERLSNFLDTKYSGLIVKIKALKEQVVIKKNEWNAQRIANRKQDEAWWRTSQGQRVRKDIF